LELPEIDCHKRKAVLNILTIRVELTGKKLALFTSSSPLAFG